MNETKRRNGFSFISSQFVGPARVKLKKLNFTQKNLHDTSQPAREKRKGEKWQKEFTSIKRVGAV